MTMVLETDYKISKDLIWLAEGYKHRVPHNSESEKDTAQPYEHDSFTLFPRESVPTYAEILIDTPEVLQHTSRRVHSATERSTHFRQGRPGTAPVTRPTGRPPSGRKYGWAGNYDRSAASSRPGSGYRPASVASGETTPTRRRVQSAGSIAARTRAIAKMRQGFTLVNRLYENDVISQNISLHPVSPAPDYKYFDRHSRCHDHTHMHDDLLRDRPQTACAGEPCGGFSRPGSASSQRSRLTDAETMSQPQRYINYHRPKTAPATRREWRSLPRTHFLFRGKQPKFCNIVQQVQLHAREAVAKSNTDDIGADDSDYDGVDYLQKSIDGDQLLRKWRQQSESSISVTEPEAETEVSMETPPPTEEKDSGGMDGRPGSPEVEDDVSKFKDLPSEVVSPSPPVPPLRDLEPLEVKVPPSPPDSKLLRRFTPTRMPFHRTLSLSIATGEVDLTKLIDEDIDKSKLPSSNKETKKPYQPPTLFIPAMLGPSEQTEGHGDTPAQPPPSPEVPKEPEEVKVTEPPPEPKKRIRSANKKSKKPINRTKTKPKEVEVKKEEEPKPETPPPPPPELEEDMETSNKKDYEVHIAIPDLPEFKEKEKTPPKEKKKPQKHAIVIPKFEPPKEDLLFDEDLRLRLQQLDFSMEPQSPEDTPKKQKAAWVTGRLALSQQSSRFELPMDMKVLETMTTQDYIKKYCKITKRRQKLYNDVFRRSSKTKDRSQYIPFNELEKAMKDVMVNTITSEHMKLLVDILQLNEDTFIDSELFSAIAALAERLLYPQFVTQETVDRQDYKKETIECADFSALEWKFHGVDVNPAIRRLLTTIC